MYTYERRVDPRNSGDPRLASVVHRGFCSAFFPNFKTDETYRYRCIFPPFPFQGMLCGNTEARASRAELVTQF